MKKKKAIFRATPGAMFNDEQAQVIGGYLYQLAGGKADTLTPTEILGAARPVASPIHDFFNWDDTAAAELWRLTQARHITSHIEVVIVGEDDERAVRAFINVTMPENDDADERRVYMTAEAVANSEYFRSQAISDALSEVKRWQAKYREYRELALIFGAIEQTQKKINFPKQTEARA